MTKLGLVDNKYTPTALYFEDSDALEYVRDDHPHVYRRIDECLSLILDLKSRDPVGFKIKGFRHFYLKTVRPNLNSHNKFPSLIKVLEQLMTDMGDGIFADSRLGAYTAAAEIAKADQVVVLDLPDAA